MISCVIKTKEIKVKQIRRIYETSSKICKQYFFVAVNTLRRVNIGYWHDPVAHQCFHASQCRTNGPSANKPSLSIYTRKWADVVRKVTWLNWLKFKKSTSQCVPSDFYGAMIWTPSIASINFYTLSIKGYLLRLALKVLITLCMLDTSVLSCVTSGPWTYAK